MKKTIINIDINKKLFNDIKNLIEESKSFVAAAEICIINTSIYRGETKTKHIEKIMQSRFNGLQVRKANVASFLF